MAQIGHRDHFRAALAATSLVRGLEKLGHRPPSVQEISSEYGCEAGAIAKSHLFRSMDRAVLAVMSGDNTPDHGKLAAAVGAEVGEADQAFVRAVSEWTIRGGSPPEHVTPIDAFMDVDLLRFEEIWVIVGSPRSMFPTEPAKLRDGCDAVVTDLKAT